MTTVENETKTLAAEIDTKAEPERSDETVESAVPEEKPEHTAADPVPGTDSDATEKTEAAAPPAAEPATAGAPVAKRSVLAAPVVLARSALAAARPHAVTGLAVLTVVALALAGWMGYEWHSSASAATALRQQNTDRAAVSTLAQNYTLRSLSYDYRNLPGFFDGVDRDAAPALQKRYSDVHDTLAKIMTAAQVVATGKVVATAVQPEGNNQYDVTVFATQTTQNVQQPTPATVPNLLSVTVAKAGGRFQVTDYGPK